MQLFSLGGPARGWRGQAGEARQSKRRPLQAPHTGSLPPQMCRAQGQTELSWDSANGCSRNGAIYVPGCGSALGPQRQQTV